MSAEYDPGRVPPTLRDAVAADLHAVRVLASPGTRALWVAPLAAALLVAAPVVFSWRHDLAAVGWPLSWGASLVQVVIGVLLVVAALREAVPGRSASTRALAGVIGGAGVLLVLVTVATASTTHLAPLQPARIGRICFVGSLASGLPVVALAGALVAVAFPLRPALTGSLYGLGAGLMADAGWRLFCEFSGPAHVFPYHAGAVVATLLLGVTWSVLLSRVRSFGRS